MGLYNKRPQRRAATGDRPVGPRGLEDQLKGCSDHCTSNNILTDVCGAALPTPTHEDGQELDEDGAPL
jgi:hypothetical protein